jgi:hypothetical protein
VLNVERNVKYLSSPMAPDQYTAKNVTLSEDLRVGIKLTNHEEEVDFRSS